MHIDTTQSIVAKSEDFSSAQFSIDSEDMRYISSLLRNNYSDSILACIREIYCNALDATKENGQDPSKIIVSVPTALDPNFSIRDFGRGLTKEQFFSLYTKIGKSTKRNNNSAIGAFGIGRLAPLSYHKEGFTITSFVNGTKSVYFMYISEENDTKIDELFSGPTEEENGLLISIPVLPKDINSFIQKIPKFFAFFDVLPNFKNYSYNPITKPKPLFKGVDWEICSGLSSQDICVMGGVPYPLNFGSMNYSGILKDAGLVIHAQIGEVSLHHSRESLEYNPKTQQFIKSKLDKIEKEMIEAIESDLDKEPCLIAALAKFKGLLNSCPNYKISRVIEAKDIKYKTLPAINKYRVYYEVTSPSIPVSVKTIGINSAGLIVEKGISSYYGIRPDLQNCCFILHDKDNITNYKKRLSLFLIKNPKIGTIYYIKPTAADGIKKFKEENHLGLISKPIVLNLSEIAENADYKPYSKKRCANNFFKFKDNGKMLVLTDETLDDKVLNDSNIVKIYIPVRVAVLSASSSASATPTYVSTPTLLTEYKSLLNSASSKFWEWICGKKYIFVGVNISTTKTVKFKLRTDFVNLTKALLDAWEAIPNKTEIFTANAKKLVAEKYFLSNEEGALIKLLLKNDIKNGISKLQQFQELLAFEKQIAPTGRVPNDEEMQLLRNLFANHSFTLSITTEQRLELEKEENQIVNKAYSDVVKTAQKIYKDAINQYPLLNYLDFSSYNLSMAKDIVDYINS